MSDWNAALYLKFERDRTRPVIDMLTQLPLKAPQSILDLGCGPGNSTEHLVQRFDRATVTGLDSSPDMLRKARERLPQVTFRQADILTWSPERPFDLVFANAVLQWIPGHAELFPRMLSWLSADGCLAVQMPDNLDEPSHALMRETALTGPWREKFNDIEALRERIAPMESYYSWLSGKGAEVDIWKTTYGHVLDGPGAIVEWLKSTGLRPYLDRLDEGEQSAFLERYEAALADAYPRQSDGKVLLRFPRLFMVAIQGG
jgi:trans-aconitate 2-methyltransferase